jgi:hypothetical protein
LIRRLLDDDDPTEEDDDVDWPLSNEWDVESSEQSEVVEPSSISGIWLGLHISEEVYKNTVLFEAELFMCGGFFSFYFSVESSGSQ